MIGSVEEYLARLKAALRGSDPALIQDALADAEEHLRTALQQSEGAGTKENRGSALPDIIGKYGSPEETAAAYRELESRFPIGIGTAPAAGRRNPALRFLGVYSDPRAWGGFFYMLVAAITGTIYGLWAVIGSTFSLLSMMLVVGVPLASVFLLSVRGLALLEGRLVEAMLGVRMPRRPLFVDRNLGWMEKLRSIFTTGLTWKALVYLFLQFPLGWIYTLLLGGLLTFSICFIASPLLELVLHLPLELFGNETFTPVWLLPFICAGGFGLLTLMLHLSKGVGRLHARYARAMLVKRKGDPDVS